MSAYVIVQGTFHPGPELTEYRQHAMTAIEKFGGKFLVRGKDKVVLDGNDNGLNTVVVIEFESQAQARAWYASPEYSKALALSPRAMTREMFVVEGL